MNVQEIASASALIKSELAPAFEKIGQGAEWGYGIFIKQAYVNAFTELLWIVPGSILLFMSAKLWKKGDDGDSEARFGGLFCLGFGLLLVLLPCSSLIQVVVNPDYAAIMLIIQTLKGK